MRLFFLLAGSAALALALGSCGSGSGSATSTSFCDTVCLKDTLKYEGSSAMKPFVHIVPTNCSPDSVTWGMERSESDHSFAFSEYLRPGMKINKDFVKTSFRDTAMAYVQFNDCQSGRGYLLKLPYGKGQNIQVKPTAVTPFDKKFSITGDLVVYTDRGNIFVEEVATGKEAMMTFGKQLDINYEDLHQTLDSVNITATRIWAKVKIDDKWQEMEKNITLK
ncbi:hypothetical protein [Terrimonas ferruginea]|uniref:hypothetical protein n=1 Tax=Terrimonas ferruginea TaxID=249 RepID=UPI00040B4204|nr:hypothetical protein [Terrimonas ferruginea]